MEMLKHNIRITYGKQTREILHEGVKYICVVQDKIINYARAKKMKDFCII